MSVEINLKQPEISLKKIVVYTIALTIWLVLTAYVIQWNRYKTYTQIPAELEGFSFQDFGLNESLTLYFEASDYRLDGRPLTDGNYLITLETESGNTTYERVSSQGQQHEAQSNGYITHYSMPPLNTIGQRYQLAYAGIPIATGGHYVIRDENGRTVDTVTDDQGMDLHDFIITPEGNYLYMSVHTPVMYPDSTLTCLPKCGNLGQSIVEIASNGQELYRYNLLDFYTRDDFIMDDMLTWGNWNLYDLTHANSVRLSPDGTELIVSVRHTNEVIALNRSNGLLAWRSSDYTFINDEYEGFSHQHDAQILSNGNLLLFDNGNDRGQHSRVVEYEIDHDNQTMTLVWEYSNGHYQPNRGSARRTPQGNTLINWVEHDTDDIEIVSADGQTLFTVTIPKPYASYRASFSYSS